MTKPLSMDIRERARARLEAGETVRAVADALSIAPSSVVKWSERKRITGSVAPGKIGGHVLPKLRGAEADGLRARMAEGDFTLRGLVAELAERGLKVDTGNRSSGMSLVIGGKIQRAANVMDLPVHHNRMAAREAVGIHRRQPRPADIGVERV